MERLINTDYRRPLDVLDYDEACLDECVAQVEPLQLTEGLLQSLSVLMVQAPLSLTPGQQTEVKSQSGARPNSEGRLPHRPSGTLEVAVLPALAIAQPMLAPHTQAPIPVVANAVPEPPVEHVSAPMPVLVGTRGEPELNPHVPLAGPLPAARPVSVPIPISAPVPGAPPAPAAMTLLVPASKAGEGLQVPFNNGRVSGMLQVTLAEGHQGLLVTPGHPALLEPLREPFARLDHQAWRLAEEGDERRQGESRARPDEDDDDAQCSR
ncbi:hypothetical protein [Pseudomonas rubra]|uniref:Type III secretion effector protein n=1 Tax=Pseudomonas rubra TaxID=2942627 RepID=A0ABT5PCS8_9PSED|nr:hypothetical protein [Pseudomonas rubra]MDD1016012.1 hypothetical protein [Pseudomonas rubra]MDD1039217.1 hypothetical protein [Pseudomonas rubra]MDD1155187.1 hypothetical protein [Pseudomonas rubra]